MSSKKTKSHLLLPDNDIQPSLLPIQPSEESKEPTHQDATDTKIDPHWKMDEDKIIINNFKRQYKEAQQSPTQQFHMQYDEIKINGRDTSKIKRRWQHIKDKIKNTQKYTTMTQAIKHILNDDTDELLKLIHKNHKNKRHKNTIPYKQKQYKDWEDNIYKMKLNQQTIVNISIVLSDLIDNDNMVDVFKLKQYFWEEMKRVSNEKIDALMMQMPSVCNNEERMSLIEAVYCYKVLSIIVKNPMDIQNLISPNVAHLINDIHIEIPSVKYTESNIIVVTAYRINHKSSKPIHLNMFCNSQHIGTSNFSIDKETLMAVNTYKMPFILSDLSNGKHTMKITYSLGPTHPFCSFIFKMTKLAGGLDVKNGKVEFYKTTLRDINESDIIAYEHYKGYDIEAWLKFITIRLKLCEDTTDVFGTVSELMAQTEDNTIYKSICLLFENLSNGLRNENYYGPNEVETIIQINNFGVHLVCKIASKKYAINFILYRLVRSKKISKAVKLNTVHLYGKLMHKIGDENEDNENGNIIFFIDTFVAVDMIMNTRKMDSLSNKQEQIVNGLCALNLNELSFEKIVHESNNENNSNDNDSNDNDTEMKDRL